MRNSPVPTLDHKPFIAGGQQYICSSILNRLCGVCRAYLAVIASNGGLEANLLISSVPLTLNYIFGNIVTAIQQVHSPQTIIHHAPSNQSLQSAQGRLRECKLPRHINIQPCKTLMTHIFFFFLFLFFLSFSEIWKFLRKYQYKTTNTTVRGCRILKSPQVWLQRPCMYAKGFPDLSMN